MSEIITVITALPSNPLNLSTVMEDHKNTDAQSAVDYPVAPKQNRASGVRSVHFNESSNFALWKKGSRLFSALVAINVLLLGCALITSSSQSNGPIQESVVLIFLSVLMLLSVLWMFFQIYFTNKHQNAILFKDCHAGPIWMKGGLLIFGLCTILLDALKVGYFVGYISCLSFVHVVFPVIQSAFVIAQTYFLWVSCKHCIQIHLNPTRCGLMLLLATNFAVWMTTVTDESSHLTREMLKHLKDNVTHNNTTDSHEVDALVSALFAESEEAGDCKCNYVCHILKTAYYYLYPFCLEYSLFACAMSYVMWKNVGRKIDDHVAHPYRLKLRSFWQIPFGGVICGLITLFVGLALFVVYELQIKNEEKRGNILIVFFIFHIVCLGLMSLGAIGGWIIYKFDKRQMDNEKNPSRTLDMGLLVGATLGQYCISYYSIAAMVASNPRDILKILTLTMSLLMIVQHSLQNVFIIEGLHRKMPKEWQQKHAEQPPKPRKHSFGPDKTSHEDENSIPAEPTNKLSQQRMSVASIRATISSSLSTHRKRRMLLREIYVFLLLGNILFWILPAFGARLRFDNHLEVNFYGLPIWVIITNICLPICIFYRMHAVACLVELCFSP